MRTPRPLLLSLLFSLLLSLPPAAVLAGPRDDGPDPDRRAKVMAKIETVRIARLTEALELDAALAEKLFPVLRPFQERRRKAQMERLEGLRVLREELESETPDAKVVAERLDALMATNAELAAIGTEEYAALKPVLDPVRLARYYRFQLEFERRIGELIREVKGAPAKDGDRPFKRPRDRRD